jgi:hypothetical protein
MAEKNLNSKIPAQSITYIVLCLTGLLILILGGIFPAYRTTRGLDDKITILKGQIEKQNTLAPMYASFLKRAQTKQEETLPLPNPEKLSSSRLTTLSNVFRTEAKASGISLVSVVPIMNALSGDAQYIPVDVTVRGDFAAFRKFLLHLGGLPYISHIEEIAVQVGPDGRDYKTTVLISVG